MKRLLALVFSILLLVSAWAGAEMTDMGAACKCNRSPCICFLQRGDTSEALRGVIALLKENDYFSDGRVKVTVTEKVENAIKAFQRDEGLTQSGMLDDETLTRLLWGMSSAQLDRFEPLESDRIVWVSSKGGEKYHARIKCGSMDTPRKMTLRNAQKLNVEPCRRCANHLMETEDMNK